MPLTLNTIRFKMVQDSADTNGAVYYDFDIRLHHAGTDFTVYANNVIDGQVNVDVVGVTAVLYQILVLLFNDRSGVELVKARPFQLSLRKSRAVPTAEITELIRQGINRAGWEAAQLP